MPRTAELLEVRELLAVTVAHNYAGISFAQSQGYIPPDTCGAAGPTGYVETTNQSVALFTSKTTGTSPIIMPLNFFLFGVGRLPRADGGSGLSDPIVVYDDRIGRFIIGDQDVDFNTHVSTFDIAVSKTSTPQTLGSSDWNFYQISTTENNYDADYPGNFGYNNDAFVFTLNMFGVFGDVHVQVDSISASALAGGVPQGSLPAFKNDVNGFSFRPTTMHDSVPGDPMWLVAEGGDGRSIDVVKMTNVLSNTAKFTFTRLTVDPYSSAVPPLNPDGSAITFNIDSRILKSAEWNNLLVAAHTVSNVAGTEDYAQWYEINLKSGTPVLLQQGQINAGSGVYITYPGIDINSSGQIGMSFIRQGTDTPSDYMSMYVTGRIPSDPVGTMAPPVIVSSGVGQAIYTDFGSPYGAGREGDLSGINVDPGNGTFWAANEFATAGGFFGANWGTAIANFSPVLAVSAPSITMAVALSPTTAFLRWTAGANLQGYRVYLITNGGNTRTLLGTYSPATLSASVGGLTPGASNELIVQAYNNSLNPNTADSLPVFVTTPGGIPAPVVNAIATSPTTVMLAWQSIAGAQGYRVYTMINNQQVLLATLGPTATSLQIVGLAPNTTAQFMVEAFVGSVVSDSAWVYVTTPPLINPPKSDPTKQQLFI